MARKPMNLAHFAGRANEAAFWEAWVGAVLARCGLYTVHHPFTVANSLKQVKDYYHTWDLDVSAEHPHDYIPGRGLTPTEVKSVALTFTGPEDYPFEQCLVCSEASHKRKRGELDSTGTAFLLVSRATGAIVYVPVGTKLLVKEVHDGDRGETYKAVYCRKEDLRALKEYVQAVGG
jgi:hypothetical protein